MGGLGGLTPVDLEKVLAGRIASASADIDSYTHGLSGSATPKDLETALQLAYLTFTAPGLTADGLDLLKRRFVAMLANQQQSPRYVFSEKVRELTTSGHYSARGLTAGDGRVARPRGDAAHPPRALRQRRRLHLLHRRRVHRGRRSCRWWSDGWRRCPRPGRAAPRIRT